MQLHSCSHCGCMRASENRRQWKMEEKLCRGMLPYFRRTVLLTKTGRRKSPIEHGCPQGVAQTNEQQLELQNVCLGHAQCYLNCLKPLHKPSSSLTEKNENAPSHSHPAEVCIKLHFCQTEPCFTAHDIGSEYFPDTI